MTRRSKAIAAAIAAAAIARASAASADRPPAAATPAIPAPSSRPSPRTSSLAWVREPGAEACIDARALALAVEKRLGRAALVAPTAGDLAIEGRVEKREAPPSWHATIAVADASGARVGTRELTSDRPDCHALDEELGLVVSLLIEPEAAFAPPRNPPPPHQPPPAPACPPPAPPPAPPPTKPKPWRVAAEAGAVIGLGLMPSQPAGGMIFRGRATPPVGPSFELGGSVWLDNHVAVGPGTATFSLAFGSAAICPMDLGSAGNTLSGCVGARVGSLRVGEVPSRFRQESLIVDVTLEARARRRLVGPLLLALGVGLAVPTRRDQFFYVDAGGTRRDVFRASPVAGTLDLALGLEIP